MSTLLPTSATLCCVEDGLHSRLIDGLKVQGLPAYLTLLCALEENARMLEICKCNS
jgi:hypothetical protein